LTWPGLPQIVPAWFFRTSIPAFVRLKHPLGPFLHLHYSAPPKHPSTLPVAPHPPSKPSLNCWSLLVFLLLLAKAEANAPAGRGQDSRTQQLEGTSPGFCFGSCTALDHPVLGGNRKGQPQHHDWTSPSGFFPGFCSNLDHPAFSFFPLPLPEMGPSNSPPWTAELAEVITALVCFIPLRPCPLPAIVCPVSTPLLSQGPGYPLGAHFGALCLPGPNLFTKGELHSMMFTLQRFGPWLSQDPGLPLGAHFGALCLPGPVLFTVGEQNSMVFAVQRFCPWPSLPTQSSCTHPELGAHFGALRLPGPEQTAAKDLDRRKTAMVPTPVPFFPTNLLPPHSLRLSSKPGSKSQSVSLPPSPTQPADFTVFWVHCPLCKLACIRGGGQPPAPGAN
jgi:hypothetical protein